MAPLIAEALGRDARETDAVRRTLRAGIWAATLVAAPMMALLWFTGPLLAVIGEPPALAEAAGSYMRVLQWAMWPALLFMACAAPLAALERPGWALAREPRGAAAQRGARPVARLPGGAGLGMAGIGLATVFLGGVQSRPARDGGAVRPPPAPLRLLDCGLALRSSLLGRVFRLGLPIAATGLAEAGLFEAAALGMGLFGASQLAAHAVAIQIAAFCFMVPNGVAQAATVRVGLAFGRRSAAGVRRAGLVALGLGSRS